MQSDLDILIRDKYAGDAARVTDEDRERLNSGEPLAYVIGWIPFLGTRIYLDSKPLIPRPETEWWTEQLQNHVRTTHDSSPFSVLDLCAGSGCIGIAMARAFPQSHISFAELHEEHVNLIQKNITEAAISASTSLYISDVFSGLPEAVSFDYIATNPPYIPTTRTLESSVTEYEPSDALFAGNDGLSIITRIASQAHRFLKPEGELWMECDISNIDAAAELLSTHFSHTEIRADQYGRPRIVVAYSYHGRSTGSQL